MLYLETMRKDQRDVIDKLGITIGTKEEPPKKEKKQLAFDDSTLKFNTKDVKGSQSPLGGLERKISEQVLSRKRTKLKKKYENQKVTSSEDIIKDMKVAITNLETCLDESEISKLPFKN